MSKNKPRKEIFTETPNTKGPMKPGEKVTSPDKPKVSPKDPKKK